MTITTLQARSGKGHRDENFPVASWLIHPRHRPPILAFYEFVRTADDIADHAGLPAQEKLALMDRLEASLSGKDNDEPVAVTLRSQLAAHRLSPRHALDLLAAFRMDVTKLRYRDWDDLIGYCSYSAMPVGRFVLDVHGESRVTWPANDALCAARWKQRQHPVIRLGHRSRRRGRAEHRRDRGCDNPFRSPADG